jgi:molecular chaperone DnaK (HSP70)
MILPKQHVMRDHHSTGLCFFTFVVFINAESIENMKRLIAILILISFFFSAAPQENHQGNQDPLLGIDFGSEWIKLAVISQGSRADTVLNENSKRKSLSAILFPEPASSSAPRQFGEAAMVRPHKVFGYLRELLGTEYNRNGKYGPHQYYQTIITDRRGQLKIVKDKDSYSPEFLNAMLLHYSKARAEAHSGKNISKCVITVPPYFTSTQRLALLSAARIAGNYLPNFLQYLLRSTFELT